MSCWTLVQQDSFLETPSSDQLKTALESKNDFVKISAMKTILRIIINGDPLSSVLMHVIRFVMPSRNKELKKLLYYYWEICPKYNSDGTMKQEMILACNSFRNDLQHPNEYIRGATLRFLCKLNEPELLEPLIPTVRQCLEHRHAYVRKNAIMSVFSIYQTSSHLIPDAASLIEDVLVVETEGTCKRNALIVLCTIDPEHAAMWLTNNFDHITSLNASSLLIVIEFIRKIVIVNSPDKTKYFSLLLELLHVNSSSVVFEASTSLMNMTTNIQIIKTAASRLLDLATREADNNAKLIMLDRISDLVQHVKSGLDDIVTDVLPFLASTDFDVCEKAISIILGLVTTRNVDDILEQLQKELSKSNGESENDDARRRALTEAIHHCAITFPQTAATAIQYLLSHISDFQSKSASSVLSFVKEVMEKFPELRSANLTKLLLSLKEFRAGKIFRGVVWIAGEYCFTEADIRTAWKSIRASIGEIPILASEEQLLNDVSDRQEQELLVDVQTAPSSSRKILADGTYATESAVTSESLNAAKLEAVRASKKPPLRTQILGGDYYLATVLASALTKLVMRFHQISDNLERLNALRAEATLIMTSIIRVGQSKFVKYTIDDDSIERILSCIKVLYSFEGFQPLQKVFLEDTKNAFSHIVIENERRQKAEASLINERNAMQPDDTLSIRQLSRAIEEKAEASFEADVIQAASDGIVVEDLSSKLDHVVSLTGYTDPVYVEAYVKIQQFDIILDILIVNRTDSTLQNLCLELATLGDLKIVERPSPLNLAPRAFNSVQATIKVSSTDSGVIFGAVSFGGKASEEDRVVNLSSISLNLMDYIKPASCPESKFRSMWTEFEWENKVDISSNENINLMEFLHKLMKKTNMNCLTPDASLRGDCGFLSANLYARSIFGEDALMSLSVEKSTNGPISGHVRIRSKTQGIALTLGSLVAA
ncbi:coatomer beta subunit [Schizosaccharomyces octosporus yFS286]|uniref:Coatomer subunit beta n=1 Tax=Schizosaccharomyces octosporus (strain yFS286) TaxID=483514 RepID=S9Q3R2_SCHOY|nr:coatomer beta subunit [Schizosaccharomyces octosporus yFS286]EPX74303.1 coatomer beta subunit [Schizosaccharomyces octosporus yFS286]